MPFGSKRRPASAVGGSAGLDRVAQVLALAQETADQAIADAQEKAAQIIADAQEKAAEIIASAQGQARLSRDASEPF